MAEIRGAISRRENMPPDESTVCVFEVTLKLLNEIQGQTFTFVKGEVDGNDIVLEVVANG